MVNEQPAVLLALTDVVEQTQIEQALSEAGYRVFQAMDSAQLVREAERLRPGALLIDEGLGRPGGGLSVCRLLKANPRTRALAVIMVCGRGSALMPTDGTDGLQDEVLVRPLHPPEAVVRVAAVARLHRYAVEVVQGSRIDPLTGTFNHSYMVDRLKHEVLRASRYGRSLALLLADVDGFSALNQAHGTTCGDLMLREVARALSSRLRGVDLVSRTGADEFSVVLPETSLLVARPVAERLRRAVEGLQCQLPQGSHGPRTVQATVSVGVAGIPHPDVADLPELLRCARAALARASAAGGNRSVLY